MVVSQTSGMRRESERVNNTRSSSSEIINTLSTCFRWAPAIAIVFTDAKLKERSYQKKKKKEESRKQPGVAE